MVDEILLGAVGPDIAFEGELARDDLLDRNLLVPAVATVLLLAAWLGDVLGAAQCAPSLGGRSGSHQTILVHRVVAGVRAVR